MMDQTLFTEPKNPSIPLFSGGGGSFVDNVYQSIVPYLTQQSRVLSVFAKSGIFSGTKIASTFLCHMFA